MFKFMFPLLAYPGIQLGMSCASLASVKLFPDPGSPSNSTAFWEDADASNARFISIRKSCLNA